MGTFALQREIAEAQLLIIEERIHAPVSCGPFMREPFMPTYDHLYARGEICRLLRDLQWLQENRPRVWAELAAEQSLDRCSHFLPPAKSTAAIIPVLVACARALRFVVNSIQRQPEVHQNWRPFLPSSTKQYVDEESRVLLPTILVAAQEIGA